MKGGYPAGVQSSPRTTLKKEDVGQYLGDTEGEKKGNWMQHRGGEETEGDGVFPAGEEGANTAGFDEEGRRQGLRWDGSRPSPGGSRAVKGKEIPVLLGNERKEEDGCR